MTAARDPIRLCDMGSQAPAELASAIRTLRTDEGSSVMAEALAQRLATQLGRSALAGATGTPAASSCWLVAIVGLSLVGTVFMAPSVSREPREPREPRERSEAPMKSTAPRALFTSQPVAPRIPVEVSIAESPAPLPLHAPERPRRAARAHRYPALQPTAAKPASPQPAAELELLRRAHAVLRRDPSAALELAERHASEYPRGVFAQEREILAIEALLKQRKRALAFARAEQFVDRYSSSPYAFRIQAMIDQRPRGGSTGSLVAASAAVGER
jgi:hypothetical protein